MPIFRRWRPDEDELLTRLYPDPAYSRAEIENALHRTWYSIVERAQKLQLSRRAPKEWSKEELILLAQLFPDLSLSREQLEQVFRRSWDAIYQKALKLGLTQSTRRPRSSSFKNHPHQWSEAQIAMLHDIFPSATRQDMEEKLRRTWPAIQAKASEIGLHRLRVRKYEVHANYFQEINSEKQAYILGLLAADGSVADRGTVEIELQHRDRTLVEFVRDEIAPGVPLRERHGTRLYFSCTRMASDLARFGIVPRKSYNFAWPQALPEAFAIPFLLGYFDGDGYFRQGRPGGWQWELLGTYDFLVAVMARLEYYVRIELRDPRPAKRNVSPHLFRLSVTGKRVIAIDRVLNASALGLPRKHLPPNYRF